jgi:hypothetical protein
LFHDFSRSGGIVLEINRKCGALLRAEEASLLALCPLQLLNFPRFLWRLIFARTDSVAKTVTEAGTLRVDGLASLIRPTLLGD